MYQKLHREQCLAAAGAAANQSGAPCGQAAAGDFIESANSRT
jgi:hypothetical protein